MKTASVTNIRGLQKGIWVAGLLGVIVAMKLIRSDPVSEMVALFCIIVCWAGRKFIDRNWAYIASNSYVIHDGNTIMAMKDACYVRRSDLPKDFVNIHIRSDIVAKEIELLVASSAHRGSIDSLKLMIGFAVDNSLRGVGLYYRHFKQSDWTGSTFLRDLLYRFQKTQEFKVCAFGDAYRESVGTEEWVNEVFIKILRIFLEKEAVLVGLRVKTIKVIPGANQRSILVERKG